MREEALDDGREDEMEDEKEVSRGTPAIEVALTEEFTGRQLEGPVSGLAVSPARSAKVLRESPFAGGGIAVKRALVAELDIS